MNSLLGPRFCGALVLSAIAAWALPARAAEADRYLPDDTAFILAANVRQFLDSPLARTYGLERIRAALASGEADKVTLESLGVDPLRDVGSLVMTRPAGGDGSRGLLIIHGRFDPAGFRAGAARMIQAGHLTVVQAGGHLFYQAAAFGVFARQRQPAYFAVADGDTLVASQSWAYVVEALDRAADKRKPLLNPQVLDLVHQADARQAVWVVEWGHSVLARMLGQDRFVRDLVDPIQAVTGGIAVADGLYPAFVLTVKDARAARNLSMTMNVRMKEAVLVLAIAGKPKYRALEKSLKTVQANPNNRTVVLAGRFPAEVLDEGLKKLQ